MPKNYPLSVLKRKSVARKTRVKTEEKVNEKKQEDKTPEESRGEEFELLDRIHSNISSTRTLKTIKGCYNPFNTKIDTIHLEDWAGSRYKGELMLVPGIKEAQKKKLEDAGVHRLSDLMAKYMTMKREDDDCRLLVGQRMYIWLRDHGVNTYRSDIIYALERRVCF